jgi:hypothetical protein
MCKKVLVPSKYCRIKLFCSKKCREKHWNINNKQKSCAYKKRYRLSIPVFCIYCKNQIPNERRASGVRTCSDACARLQTNKLTRVRKSEVTKLFCEYKQSQGCSKCGYAKNGACLDFHHIDEKTKERRITAMLWYNNTDLFKKEVKKCSILCKNCHYDYHNPTYQIKENGDIT